MHVAIAAPSTPIIGINIKFNTRFMIAPTEAERKKPLLSLCTVYSLDKKVPKVKNTEPTNRGGVYIHAEKNSLPT